MNKKRLAVFVVAAVLGLAGCQNAVSTDAPEATATVAPTKEAEPTVTPEATATVAPTKEAEPTATPEATAEPTATPIPTVEPTAEPTATPIPTVEPTAEPTATPTPTKAPTPKPTATPKPIATPTATPKPTATSTPVSVTDAQCFEFEQTDDGNIRITGLTDDTLKVVVIPDMINGIPVVEIGEYAFFLCDSLTSITIPDCVTAIGSEAFRGCSSLTSITIPESVTEIGAGVIDRTPWFEAQKENRDYLVLGDGILYWVSPDVVVNHSQVSRHMFV